MIKFLMAIWHPGPYFLLAIFLSLANIINIHIPWFICVLPVVAWLLISLGIVVGFLWTVYLALQPVRKFIKK